MTSLALSKTVISSDVVGSSGGRRRQSHLDTAHDLVLDKAFAAASKADGAMGSAFRRVDGDSATIVIDAAVSRAWVLADFVLREVVLALGEVNQTAGEEYRLRLRMAVDFGEVASDPPHVQGDAVVGAARLRDAKALREAMSGSPQAQLGLIVSDRFHREVVVHGERGLDADVFYPVDVDVKTYSERGWVYLAGTASKSTPAVNPLPHNRSALSASDRRAVNAEVFNVFEDRVYAPHGVFGVVRDRRG